MYKQDLTLNNIPELIYNKPQPTIPTLSKLKKHKD